MEEQFLITNSLSRSTVTEKHSRQITCMYSAQDRLCWITGIEAREKSKMTRVAGSMETRHISRCAHTRSQLSAAAHLRSHSRTSTGHWSGPVSWPIGDPPTSRRWKHRRAVFKKLRASRRDDARGACACPQRTQRPTHLFLSRQWRNKRELVSRGSCRGWKEDAATNAKRGTVLKHVPTSGASRRIKGCIGGYRVAMRRAAKPAPAGYHHDR